MTTKDLFGLVMMGGKSTRMGFDKSIIPYHGKPHCQYLYELISDMVEEAHVSIRKDQERPFTDHVVVDAFAAKGPLNGLLSAHKAFPDKAWLVIAIDLPFITPQSIRQLIECRNKNKMATVFTNTEDGQPEPLVAIWEPEALKLLHQHYSKGEEIYPRNFLQIHEVQTLSISADIELFNVNNPSDFEKAKTVIEQLK